MLKILRLKWTIPQTLKWRTRKAAQEIHRSNILHFRRPHRWTDCPFPPPDSPTRVQQCPHGPQKTHPPPFLHQRTCKAKYVFKSIWNLYIQGTNLTNEQKRALHTSSQTCDPSVPKLPGLQLCLPACKLLSKLWQDPRLVQRSEAGS